MKLHQHSIIRLVKKYIGEPEAGAEIGVHRGGTSAVLRAKFPKCRMFFVDAWKYWEEGESYNNDKMGRNSAEEWHKIMEEAVSRIHSAEGGPFQIIHDTSRYASMMIKDKFLDFVFIDANHSYESVKEDIQLWLPKTKTLMMGHDYKSRLDRKGAQGVSRAVHEIFGEDNVMSSSGLVWSHLIK